MIYYFNRRPFAVLCVPNGIYYLPAEKEQDNLDWLGVIDVQLSMIEKTLTRLEEKYVR